MTVYATAPRPDTAEKAIRYSRLVATTEAELDAFADVLGLTHIWRHPGNADLPPHYVIDTAQRHDALIKGAVAVKAIPGELFPVPAYAGVWARARGAGR